MLFGGDQTVLFVEDDAELRAATVQRLELEGIAVRACPSADAALPLIDADFAGIVVTDIRMPGTDGLQLFARVREIDPELPVILVTGHADVAMAVGALRAGAFDFLTKPFAADMLVAAVRRALAQRRLVTDNRALRAAAASAQAESDPLVGESAAMAQLRAQIRQLASADVDVLVEGETGTGKELVALQLHRQGPRRGKPFIAVNCGALPEALAESELFGHAADSVPQTRLSRIGQIEASSGGTLLLDEIDSMPLTLQAKLLRVLEEREVQPIGSDRPRAVDLHVIATSKRPIEEAVAAGDFRPDLFYRLDVMRLRVPALRQRGGDALLLFAAFVEEARARFDRAAPPLTDAVRRHLQAHDWPGNVRELRNFAWQTVLGEDEARPEAPSDGTLAERVRAFEKELIEAALAAHRGRVTAVLRQLGVPRKTFYDKVARLGIDVSAFR
jgi:two-component system C4-dicarboxylate transport response regulator DctD